jgi:hypothetical protein
MKTPTARAPSRRSGALAVPSILCVRLPCVTGVHFTLVNSGGSTDYATPGRVTCTHGATTAKTRSATASAAGRNGSTTGPVNDHLTLTQVPSTAADVAVRQRLTAQA